MDALLCINFDNILYTKLVLKWNHAHAVIRLIGRYFTDDRVYFALRTLAIGRLRTFENKQLARSRIEF